MIRINLLPFRKARKKENVRQQVSIFILVLIFLTLGMSYFALSLNRKIQSLDDHIKISKQQLSELTVLTKEIDDIKKKLDVIKKKTTIIKNLEQDRKSSVILLDTMTNMVIPGRMWFTSLSAASDSVEIYGLALDNKTVADFMIRLEGSKLFSSVNLKTLKQQAIKDIGLKNFEISCRKVVRLEEKTSEKAVKK
ncbi:MAG: PilN domain-containing protein [Deltaproteobacteria bacterium]|nr:PilN domain-containing protein [Deltaproteobacteria bacterium]